MGRLTARERRKFESHLVSCDCCFDDLKALDRTAEFIRICVAEDPVVPARSAVPPAPSRAVWVGFVVLLVGVAGYFLWRQGVLRPAPEEPGRPAAAGVFGPRGPGGAQGSELLARADLEVRLGRNQEALRLLLFATEMSGEMQESGVLARCWSRVAMLRLTRLLDRESGEGALREARSFLTQESPGLELLDVRHAELRALLLLQGDCDGALRVAEEIWSSCRDLSVLDPRRADALRALGLAFEACSVSRPQDGRLLDEAKRAYEEAVRSRLQSEGARGMERDLCGLARVEILGGELQNARDHLERALLCRQLNPTPDGPSLARANLALLEHFAGEREEALRDLEEVLREAERWSDPFLRCDGQALRAEILAKLGRMDEAREAVEVAAAASGELYLTPLRSRCPFPAMRRGELAEGVLLKGLRPMSSGLY